MYLEISARQTGKTTRAIKWLVEKIEKRQFDDNSDPIYYFCFNVAAARHTENVIRNTVPKQLRSKFIVVPSTTSLPIRQGTVAIYDEFDYMDPNFVQVNQGSYYVTSPSFIRLPKEYCQAINDFTKGFIPKDKLLYLLLAHQMRYVAYTQGDTGVIRHKYDRMSLGEASRLYCCSFGGNK
jgi:hypothetical protein